MDNWEYENQYILSEEDIKRIYDYDKDYYNTIF